MTKGSKDSDYVTASEVASYAFCPEAWRLGSALRLESNNEHELARGEHVHAKIAAVEQTTHVVWWVGVALIVLGALLIGVLRLVTGR
jgi:hypothetical protein